MVFVVLCITMPPVLAQRSNVATRSAGPVATRSMCHTLPLLHIPVNNTLKRSRSPQVPFILESYAYLDDSIARTVLPAPATRGSVPVIRFIAPMENVATSTGIGGVQVGGGSAAASVANVARVMISVATASASLATARRRLAHRRT